MPLLTALLAKSPDFVERTFTRTSGQYVSSALTRASGLVPFSMAEIGVFALVLAAIFLAVRGTVQTVRRRRHARNAVACAFLSLCGTVGALTILGYAFWGFNFARADLVTRQHWSSFAAQSAAGKSDQELTAYCAKLVDLANREFERAVGSRDPGRPSSPPRGLREVDASLEEGYTRLAVRLRLDPSVARNRGRAKPILASFVLDAALVGGFYSPWTGEANYNRDLPLSGVPHAIAHEKAHQRGITSEDEANFFGFLACIYSRDPYARYSGYLFAQRQLLGELARVDAARAEELAGRRAPGIQRDVEEDRRFVVSHRGVVSSVDSVLIHAYLKANRAPGGIQSYTMSSRLIVIYARAVEHPFDVIE